MAGKRARLIQRRKAVGHTQESLAEALRIDRTTVGRWEGGGVAPRPWMRPPLARALKVSVDELAVLLQAEAEPPHDAACTATSEPIVVRSAAVRVAADVAAPVWVEAVAVDACDSALFLHFASQSNVDDLVLEQLDADIGRLAKSLVSQPVTTVFSEITTLRRLVFTLLQGRQHPRQTSHLYLTAGRLCGLATHVALDLGQFTAAATHARTAWLCAESADHNGLRAWVRSVQSLIAYWQQNYSQAVELAQSGLRHADAGTIRARLLSLSARAHAACGSGSAAVRAVEAARDARHGSAGPAELPGVFTFPEAKQHAYAGTALLAIDGKGHVRQAVEASSQAIALYRCSPEEDQSSGDLLAAHLDLATAHLAAGDIDGAAEKLSVVLTAPPERRTASISHRLQTVGLRLGEPVYAGSAVARGLRESVREACHRPAPAKPPEPDQ